MKQYIKLKIILTLLILPLIACDGLLDTEPTSSASPEMITESFSGMDAVLTSAYTRLRSSDLYSYYIMAAPEILADNSQLHPINSGRFNTQAENAHGSHFTTGAWSTAYRLINEANIIIDGISKTETSQSEKDRILGEALFLRGIGYQELLRIYSYEPNHPKISDWDKGVIMRVEPVLGASGADLRARGTVIEGYKRVEADYLDALPLLDGNDRDNVYFVSKAAVHAGLARLYLYWERWVDALEHAEKAEILAIGSLTDFSTNSNIYSLIPNPESIFELSFDVTIGSSTSLNAVTSPPPGWFDLLPSDELLALYDVNDLRNNLYKVHTDGHPYIIKYSGTVGSNTDHIPVFRVAEMILIQSEAHYELQDETEAIKALDKLREHRGLQKYGVAAPTGIALLDEIYDERRRELAFEGHRWFDLKRRAMDVPKPQITLNPPVPFGDIRMLAPLSSTQVENNPKLQQNPGY